MVISIIGRQGAGKTTVGKALAQLLEIDHLEASTIVREICGDLPRSEMPKTNERTAKDPGWLGNSIFYRYKGHLVLTGVREREVHDTLGSRGLLVYPVILWADPELRFKRLWHKKCDSYEEFYQHEQNEKSIGLDFLLAQNYPAFETSETTIPTEIASAIASRLETKENIKVRSWNLLS